jgi:hypothetical protein
MYKMNGSTKKFSEPIKIVLYYGTDPLLEQVNYWTLYSQYNMFPSEKLTNETVDDANQIWS